jgi:NDP-sugar pyrophosphorylase family protein
MQIDYAFILAAGLGTRMGELSKKIPKILWPVFDKTLLDLQLAYVRSLGIRKIFMNTHHLHSEVMNYLSEHQIKDLYISHEIELLDIGGGIHKVAASPEVNYRGTMLIVNCDQFLMMQMNDLAKMYEKLSQDNAAAILASIKVDPTLGYSGISKLGNRLSAIVNPTEEQMRLREFETYGGVCLLNLEKLIPSTGRTKFFESVARYKDLVISIYEAHHLDYWDFGTKERFILSHAEALKEISSPEEEHSCFISFLLKEQALRKEKILNEKSYGPWKNKIQCKDLLIVGNEVLDKGINGPLESLL